MKRFLTALFAVKFVAILGVVGATMVWVGYTNISNARQAAPKVYTTPEDIELDGDKWIKVEQASLDITGSAYLDDLTGKQIDEIFIPLNSPGGQSPQFYLRTEDSRLLSIFNLQHSLSQKIQTMKTTVEMAKKDPEYLKMLKKTMSELEEEIRKSEAESEFYRKKHASLSQSFIGMLDPEFDKSGNYSAILGSNTHIIKHNEKPEAGFYAWFLTIVGSLLSLVALLALFGFFTKTRKNEPKS